MGSNGHSPGSGNVMEALLTMLLSERFGQHVAQSDRPSNPQADAMRSQIRTRLSDTATG